MPSSTPTMEFALLHFASLPSLYFAAQVRYISHKISVTSPDKVFCFVIKPT